MSLTIRSTSRSKDSALEVLISVYLSGRDEKKVHLDAEDESMPETAAIFYPSDSNPNHNSGPESLFVVGKIDDRRYLCVNFMTPVGWKPTTHGGLTPSVGLAVVEIEDKDDPTRDEETLRELIRQYMCGLFAPIHDGNVFVDSAVHTTLYSNSNPLIRELDQKYLRRYERGTLTLGQLLELIDAMTALERLRNPWSDEQLSEAAKLCSIDRAPFVVTSQDNPGTRAGHVRDLVAIKILAATEDETRIDAGWWEDCARRVLSHVAANASGSGDDEVVRLALQLGAKRWSPALKSAGEARLGSGLYDSRLVD